MADHITHDPIYDTVDRDDFDAMIEVERYAARSGAFDEIISSTEDHFWDPGDPAYVDFAKDDFEPPEATLLVWEATAGAMRARYERFPGFDAVAVDLLLIADDATLCAVHDAANLNPLAQIKSKVRRRDILLFVVKAKHELIECGYSELLESLGLVFMGTCR